MVQLTSRPDEAAPRARDRLRAPSGSAAADAAGLGRTRAAGFVAPGLLLIVLFLVLPAAWTIYLGVTNYRLTGLAAAHPQIVGIDNYTNALGDGRFHTSLWLTMEFVLGSAVIGQAGLGFAIAWSLRDRRGPLRRFVEAFVLLAWILPSSVVAFLWIALLDRDGGTLNAVLQTPGTACAAETSIDLTAPRAIWLRANAACSMPGSTISST